MGDSEKVTAPSARSVATDAEPVQAGRQADQLRSTPAHGDASRRAEPRERDE